MRIWTRHTLLLLFFTLASLDGCTSAAPPGAPLAATPGSSSNTPAQTPSHGAEAAGKSQSDTQETLVLVFQRSGGYAGFDDQFTVFRNGRITSSNDPDRNVDPQEVEVLLQKIEALGFYAFAAEYVPKKACCDLVSIELNVTSGNQANTVKATSGAPHIPNQLWEVVELVQQFVK